MDTISVSTPTPDRVGEVMDVLASWQRDEAPMQLHPGDIGWHHLVGAERTAADLRVWQRDGRTVAIGLVDGPDLLRLTVAPEVFDDARLADRVVADIADPDSGILTGDTIRIETPLGSQLRERAQAAGWQADEPWTPLRLSLADPVPEHGLVVARVTDPERAALWSEISYAAFANQGSPDPQRWANLNQSPRVDQARLLLGQDPDGECVAMCAVWSAGPGRPGLLEPMGVHPDHRGHGYGVAICRVAAQTLRELGASSLVVYTPASNTGGVATYEKAGFQRRDDMADLRLDR